MEIPIVYEQERRCGFREPGGLYLVSRGPLEPCGKLPLPLDRCPTCSHGIKVSRSFQWVAAGSLFRDRECSSSLESYQARSVSGYDSAERCRACPLALSARGFSSGLLNCGERAVLLLVGQKFYPRFGDFLEEAIAQGISRRIKSVPKGFRVGETWVLLAHVAAVSRPCEPCEGSGGIVVPLADPSLPGLPESKTDQCRLCEGAGSVQAPGIFAAFRPWEIQYVVKGDETDDELQALLDRGIQPVRGVRRDDETEPLPMAASS